MTINLEILAEDMSSTTYTMGCDCAITRALKRAGYPHLQDSGIGIKDMNTNSYIVTERESGQYQSLSNHVIAMYGGRIPQADFKCSLEI